MARHLGQDGSRTPADRLATVLSATAEIENAVAPYADRTASGDQSHGLGSALVVKLCCDDLQHHGWQCHPNGVFKKPNRGIPDARIHVARAVAVSPHMDDACRAQWVLPAVSNSLWFALSRALRP